jgi:hypothetical protein
MASIASVFDMRYAKQGQGVDLLHPPPPCQQRYVNRQIPLDIPSYVMNEQLIDYDINGSRFNTSYAIPTSAPRTGDRNRVLSPYPSSSMKLPRMYYKMPDTFQEWLPWILISLVLLYILDKFLIILLLKK